MLTTSLLLAFASLGIGSGPSHAPPRPGAQAVVTALLSQDAAPYRAALQGFTGQLQKANPETKVVVRILAPGANGAALAATIRSERPALLFALGSAAVEVARQVGKVPVVAGMVLRQADVLRGPQFTGVFLEFPAAVEFRYLAQILPGRRRVAVLYHASQNQRSMDEAGSAARAAGLELGPRKVTAPSEIPAILQSLANNTDVLWGLADTLVLTAETARPILLHSLQNRIPFVGLSAAWVKAGALYALDRDYLDMGPGLATELLGGRSPVSLPPVPPRKVLYLINLRTADQLKLTIPAAVLRGAEMVIE